MSTAATLDGVTMRLGGQTAVDDVTTALTTNCITGLLGRNGAGKTTLMQLLTGHRVPTSGLVRVFGENPYENAGVLGRVCFIREGQRYPDHFRVKDVLFAASIACPRWDGTLADRLVTDFGLPTTRTVKKLSRGMLSAVGIVIGLAARAPLTVFDEPYLGLDAVARSVFYERLLADVAEHPRTVVLSTHLIEEIGGLLEHVLLVDRGRILLDDDADALRSSGLVVSGPSPSVDGYARGREVLSREALAGQSRLMIRSRSDADRIDAHAQGLSVERPTLQQLVVALSLPAHGSADNLPTLEGVSR